MLQTVWIELQPLWRNWTPKLRNSVKLSSWIVLGSRWENSPHTPRQWRQSIGVRGVRTTPVFGCVVSKYYVQMCKKLQLLRDFFSGQTSYQTSLTLDHTEGLPKFRSPAPVAALSGNESLCFSIRLWFSNDVLIVGWHWLKFWSRFAFTV